MMNRGKGGGGVVSGDDSFRSGAGRGRHGVWEKVTEKKRRTEDYR